MTEKKQTMAEKAFDLIKQVDMGGAHESFHLYEFVVDNEIARHDTEYWDCDGRIDESMIVYPDGSCLYFPEDEGVRPWKNFKDLKPWFREQYEIELSRNVVSEAYAKAEINVFLTTWIMDNMEKQIAFERMKIAEAQVIDKEAGRITL